jgi:leader peptidase (prepilin peptidase)/N-methyltransferase
MTALLFFLSARELVGVMSVSGLQLITLLPLLLTIVSLYVVIVVYDIRHTMIPDMFSYSVALVSLIFAFVLSPSSILFHISAGIGAFLFFYVFWFVSRGRWMGLGDGKLALSLGFLLGPSGTVAAILLAFWSGAIVSLVLLVRDRITNKKLGISMKGEIPFAPFIVLGALLALFAHIDMGTLGVFLAI